MLPKCCEKRMVIKTEGIRFVELMCGKCGDVIYVKKQDAQIPQLLDD